MYHPYSVTLHVYSLRITLLIHYTHYSFHYSCTDYIDASMGSLNRRISLLYFTEEAADSGSYKCTCGKRIIQKKGTGWSNLFNHIKAQHPEWKDRANQGMQTLQFPKKEPISVTSSVKNAQHDE